MISGLAFIIALFSTLPIVTWALLLVVFTILLRKKRQAFNIATDITTFFAVCAWISLSKKLWNLPIDGFAGLGILVIALIYTLIFWRVYQDFDLKKLIKGIWRSTFLIFMASDLFLCVYGIIDQVKQFT